SHDDGSFQFLLLHHVVHRQAKLRTLAISEPANARGQALEFDPLASEINPAAKNAVVRKKLQHQVVGGVNIRGLACKRNPSERTAALTKQRTNVCRYESGKIVGVLYAVLQRKGADIVAVIKRDRAHLQQL